MMCHAPTASSPLAAAVEAAVYHAHLEADVLRMVLSAPAQALPVARRAGARDTLFTEPDLLVLWRALSPGPREDVLLAAADGLCLAGWWKADAPARRSYCPPWGWRGLARFACSWADGWRPFTGHCLTLTVRELSRVHGENERAARLERAALAAWSAAAGPVVRERRQPTTRRPQKAPRVAAVA